MKNLSDGAGRKMYGKTWIVTYFVCFEKCHPICKGLFSMVSNSWSCLHPLNYCQHGDDLYYSSKYYYSNHHLLIFITCRFHVDKMSSAHVYLRLCKVSCCMCATCRTEYVNLLLLIMLKVPWFIVNYYCSTL